MKKLLFALILLASPASPDTWILVADDPCLLEIAAALRQKQKRAVLWAVDTAELGAGRANLYARVRGNGSKKAIALLHHMDVVPASASFWTVPPFSGELKDGFIWLNSNTNRTWPKNLQRDRDVTMLLVDPKVPDRYAQIRGRLVSLIPDPRHEFIDRLAERYTGQKFRDLEPDEHRVTLKIQPVKVTGAMIQD